MSTPYESVIADLKSRPRKWLVTGVAGFIGSNILQKLLELDQQVTGLDNYVTGYRHNLEDVRSLVQPAQWQRFRMVEGDICNLAACRDACQGVEIVLHQAALGSVPRSMEDPLSSHESNVNGFLNVLLAARDAGAKRFVYASSSSVYGDNPVLPKTEDGIGKPLSPYAATKYINEIYADVFQRVYGLSSVGLRYFNVFGPRQDPSGAYAAVIPRWFESILLGKPLEINGDGETSRDFCYVANAVQANILSGLAPAEASGKIYNVAVAQQTTLNQLANMIMAEVKRLRPGAAEGKILYRDFRPGDIRHSLADISLARQHLGYVPSHSIGQGLTEASAWYLRRCENVAAV